MKNNEYVKKWYDESYDVRYEDFYMDNAYWVAGRQWIGGGIKNGIFAIVVAFCTFILYGNGHPTFAPAILGAFFGFAITSISFFIYAIREYDANDWQTSKIAYIFTFLFLIFTKGKVHVAIQWIFSIAGTGLYIYLSFVKPIQMFKVKREMKKKMKQMEEEEEAADKASYAKWEESYKAFRYGLPEFDIPTDDPMMIEARKLFEGYTDNKEMLKTRYRQLAKKAHPDNGGDEHMFACIIDVYEELKNKVEQ